MAGYIKKGLRMINEKYFTFNRYWLIHCKKHTELDDNKLRIALSKLTATERAKVIEGFKLLSEVSK